jgi:neuroligin
MKSHYRGHKMAVWLNLIPQLHRPGDDDVSMRHHHFRERGDHYYAGTIVLLARKES